MPGRSEPGRSIVSNREQTSKAKTKTKITKLIAKTPIK